MAGGRVPEDKRISGALDACIRAHRNAVDMVKDFAYGRAEALLEQVASAAGDLRVLIKDAHGPDNAALFRLEDYMEQIEKVSELLSARDYENDSELEYRMEEALHLLEKARLIYRRTVEIHDDGEFVTYVYRPKRADEFGIFSTKHAEKKTAIVLQGAIRYDDDFTLETVRLYRLLYPECVVIISTWENEREKMEAYDFAGTGAEICFSKPPLQAGLVNCAYQAVSSAAGIRRARELGCERICKSRTDQRFHLPNLFYYLERLLEVFPIQIESAAKKRLVAINTSSFRRIYHICDMFIYGEAMDVERYFGCPIDDRPWKSGDEVIYKGLVEFAKMRCPETWFMTYYLEGMGYKLAWTMEDSDYYRNELFIILRDSDIDLFWPKYNSDEYKDRHYNGVSTMGELPIVSLLEWLAERSV